MTLINFFTYAEYMDEKRFREAGFEYNALFSVTLSAWKLVFNKIPNDPDAPKGLGLPNIEPAPSNLGSMEGVMYELDEKYKSKLDELNQCPEEYQRRVMRVTKHDFTMVNTYVYVANDDRIAGGLRPSKEMMKKIRKTRKNLQMLYFSRLMNTPTCD